MVGVAKRLRPRIVVPVFVGSNPITHPMKKVTFVYRQRWLFSMISVPCRTDDIADAMISATQMIYASRMKERILYHTCEANASYRQRRYIIEKYSILWYNKIKKGWSAWKSTVLKENGQDRFGCDSRSIIALLVWICLQQPRYQRLSTQIPRKQKTMIFLPVTPIW